MSTIITAHSGAEGTDPNSMEFLKKAETLQCEAFEIDVRIHGSKPYLSHMRRLFTYKKCPTIYDAFESAKQGDKLVNCDLKEGVKSLRAVNKIAQEMGVCDRVIYTGNYKSNFYKDFTFGQVFLNGVAIAKEYGLKMTAENLPIMKKLIEDTKNPNIVGLNFKYADFTEDIATEAKRLGLLLSVFTVQDEAVYKRLLACDVYNITTLTPNAVLAERGKIQ